MHLQTCSFIITGPDMDQTVHWICCTSGSKGAALGHVLHHDLISLLHDDSFLQVAAVFSNFRPTECLEANLSWFKLAFSTQEDINSFIVHFFIFTCIFHFSFYTCSPVNITLAQMDKKLDFFLAKMQLWQRFWPLWTNCEKYGPSWFIQSHFTFSFTAPNDWLGNIF